ncbi:MAG TPA: MBL fold metallo-hydrolase [Gammaproteobacteria bacterium]|nr:MBL fold metallo-hydrolase [Gammaproteobacteria bacterium]
MKKLFNTLLALLLCGGLFSHSAMALEKWNWKWKDHGKKAVLPVDLVKADLAVMVLGSGGPVAMSDGRAGSSLLVFTDGVPSVLIDTGSGSFKSLALSGATLAEVHHFLYTHLHIDHTSDMSAMVKTLFFHRLGAGELLPPAINFYGPDSNVPAYDSMSAYVDGHYDPMTGVERYLHGFANAFFGGQSPFVPVGNNLPSDTASSEMTTVLNDHGGLTIKSIPVFHGGTPAVAYRVEYKGKSFVWTGDTNSSTDNIVKLAMNTDLLIYDTAIMDNPTPDFLLMFHTTPTRLGEVAAITQPKKLVLSHLSGITGQPQNLITIKQIIKMQGYLGPIVPAKDLKVFNIW